LLGIVQNKPEHSCWKALVLKNPIPVPALTRFAMYISAQAVMFIEKHRETCPDNLTPRRHAFTSILITPVNLKQLVSLISVYSPPALLHDEIGSKRTLST